MALVVFVSTPYENLGIEYLSSCLKLHGHKVELAVDPCLFRNPYHRSNFWGGVFDHSWITVERVLSLNPDIVAFSVMTDTYQWASRLAGRIKEKSAVPIVFGGVHATLSPEYVIENPAVDYVCVGEGEDVVVGLANKIADYGGCASIPGLWAKRGARVIKNEPDKNLKDLDTLPFPDKDLYYLRHGIYSGEYLMMSGRGCRYSCAFCCNSAMLRLHGPGFLRRRSVDGVMAELSAAKRKYGFRFVWFMDDNFTGDGAWLESFSESYRKYINLPFFCYSRPEDMSAEKARLLKEAGCYEAAVGVETINSGTSEIINRSVVRKSIRRAISSLKRSGIVTVAENILGLPGETEADVLALAEFYNGVQPDFVMYSWLKIFPGTPVFSRLKEMGLMDLLKIKAVSEGRDDSLACGGNYANADKFKKAAWLLVLSPFIPSGLLTACIRSKIFRFLPPCSDFFLLFVRMMKITCLADLVAPKRTYDAGARLTLRIYVYFSWQKFKRLFLGTYA